MGEEAAKSLLDASHRPLRALSLLSAAMDRLPIDEKKKVPDANPDPNPTLTLPGCPTTRRGKCVTPGRTRARSTVALTLALAHTLTLTLSPSHPLTLTLSPSYPHPHPHPRTPAQVEIAHPLTLLSAPSHP
jgi:hypothetical protein